MNREGKSGGAGSVAQTLEGSCPSPREQDVTVRGAPHPPKLGMGPCPIGGASEEGGGRAGRASGGGLGGVPCLSQFICSQLFSPLLGAVSAPHPGALGCFAPPGEEGWDPGPARGPGRSGEGTFLPSGLPAHGHRKWGWGVRAAAQ